MKEKLLHNIFLLTILALLLLLGVGFWSWQETQNNSNQLLYHAENQYQRNFWELSAAVEALNTQLAQLLVTSGREQTLLSLATLWREVYRAISCLGGFPVAMQELESTDLLLNDVAEYSYYLMRKNVLQQKPLTEKDWAQLEEFYRRSKLVCQELTTLGTRILNEDLRLQDLHTAQEDNVILAAFHSIETQIHSLPELTLEEGVRKIEPKPQTIQGELISAPTALEQGDLFLSKLNLPHEQGAVLSLSENLPVPIYTLVYQADSQPIYVEVSQRGGHILQFYQYRPVTVAQYKLKEAEEVAKKLLQTLAFPPMALVESNISGNVADLTLVPKIDDVYIYPDMVNIQVALDNNSLLSYDQTNYISRHYERSLPVPRLSQEDILQNINPNFQVTDIRLALLTDEYSGQELLTYELIGTVVEETFSNFIDAFTGEEVRIIRHKK